MKQSIEKFIGLFTDSLISELENGTNGFAITNINSFLDNLRRLKDNPNDISLEELNTIGIVISELKNNFSNNRILKENNEIINDLDQWIRTSIIEKRYPQLNQVSEQPVISQPSGGQPVGVGGDEDIQLDVQPQPEPANPTLLNATEPYAQQYNVPILNQESNLVTHTFDLNKVPRMPGQIPPVSNEPDLVTQAFDPNKVPRMPGQIPPVSNEPDLVTQTFDPNKVPRMPGQIPPVSMPVIPQPTIATEYPFNYGQFPQDQPYYFYPPFQQMQAYSDFRFQQLEQQISQLTQQVASLTQILTQQNTINNPAQTNVTKDTIDEIISAVEALITNIEAKTTKEYKNFPIKIDNMLQHQEEFQISEARNIIQDLRSCDLSTQVGQNRAQDLLNTLGDKRTYLEKLQPTLLIRKVTELLYRIDKQGTFEPDFRNNVRTLINEVQRGNMTKVSELQQAYQTIESKYVEVYGKRKEELEKQQQEAIERYRIYEKPYERQMKKKQQELEKKQDKLIQGKKYDGFVQDSPLLEKFSDQLRDAERQFGRNSEEYQARARQFYDYAQANLGKRMMKKLKGAQLILNGGNQIIVQTHLLEQSTSELHR